MTDGEEQIGRLENERYEAMLRGNAARLEALLHPDLTYIHSSGVADTKRSYVDGVASGALDYKSIARSEERIAVFGATAIVFNILEIDIDVRGTPRHVHSRAMAVWVREDDAWRLVAVQSASLEA